MSDVRQRNIQKPSEDLVPADVPTTSPSPSAAALAKQEDEAFNFLDILRFLVFILLTLSATSWLITKDSFTFNLQRPSFTRPEFLLAWLEGPKIYTDADLKEFDGTDPNKPIYLAINGTIYDVSAGKKHYGPGGSYHFFAGADASRGFVTNCFAEDRNPDLRGVELMHIPLDDPEVDSLYTAEELKEVKEEEMRVAKEKVHGALKHWVDFFEGSGKYTKVGRVKRERGWEGKGAVKALCKRAQEGRPKSRKRPEGK